MWSHSHSAWHLWTSDQPDTQNSTWLHTTLTRHRQPRPNGIQTLNPSKRAAAGPHLSLLSHRDRLLQTWVQSFQESYVANEKTGVFFLEAICGKSSPLSEHSCCAYSKPQTCIRSLLWQIYRKITPFPHPSQITSVIRAFPWGWLVKIWLCVPQQTKRVWGLFKWNPSAALPRGCFVELPPTSAQKVPSREDPSSVFSMRCTVRRSWEILCSEKTP